MTTEIQARDLKKSYLPGVNALDGVDLDVLKGQFFTLLGPNGAGKSTLINILTVLIRQDSGRFTVGGMDPQGEAAAIRAYIGVASQEDELDPAETPESLLRFQGRLFGLSKGGAHERAEELLDLFKLSSERGKKTGNLSGGNRRRLHCALALVHRPRVLFLDEPTVGMDPLARVSFWQIITGLNREEGMTVFLTTQYLEEADKRASAMALLMEGRVRFSGSVSAFKDTVSRGEDSSLEESYLRYVESSPTTGTAVDGRGVTP